MKCGLKSLILILLLIIARNLLFAQIEIEQAIMRLVNPIEMDSLSSRFNRARMNSVTKYLKTANDSTQIIIRTADAKEPLNKGSMPVFQLEYSMLDENGAMASDSINKP